MKVRQSIERYQKWLAKHPAGFEDLIAPAVQMMPDSVIVDHGHPTYLASLAAKTTFIPSRPARGAGTTFKNLLQHFGLGSMENCNCDALARMMDANGPDWCEINIDMLEARVVANAKARGWLLGKSAEWTARKLLMYAIEKSKQG